MSASQEEERKQDEVLEALRRDLEAARYAANRGRKQYDSSDPENRLVAAELKRRWNATLEKESEIQTPVEQEELRKRQRFASGVVQTRLRSHRQGSRKIKGRPTPGWRRKR